MGILRQKVNAINKSLIIKHDYKSLSDCTTRNDNTYFCEPIQVGVKKSNPRLSPVQGPRSPILAPNAVENPAYRGKSDSPNPLKSPANAPHSPGMGVRGFPLTSALTPILVVYYCRLLC